MSAQRSERDEERWARIWAQTLYTSRNKGVNVKVNKLDFVWLAELAYEALDGRKRGSVVSIRT